MLSERDVSEEAEAGPVSAEKQLCLSLTSALSSLGIRNTPTLLYLCCA